MRPRVAIAPIAFAVMLVGSSGRAQVCAPSHGPGGYRASMSRRAPGAVTVPNLSVATLMAWSPPARSEHGSVRESDSPIDDRERSAATLEGDVWRVKLGDDGCELHLEVTAVRAGADSPRVVARIPAGAAFDEARSALIAAIGGRVHRRPELRSPVRVRLSGHVFWNGDHWCERNEGRGCGHRAEVVASLWELRPVWRVEVVDGALPASGRRGYGRHHGARGGHHHHRRE